MKSKVMKMAWRIYKAEQIRTTAAFSEALKKAWQRVKAIKSAIRSGHCRFTIHHNISIYIGGSLDFRRNLVNDYFKY